MLITISWQLTAINFIHGDARHENKPVPSVKYRFASADKLTHRGVFYV